MKWLIAILNFKLLVFAFLIPALTGASFSCYFFWKIYLEWQSFNEFTIMVTVVYLAVAAMTFVAGLLLGLAVSGGYWLYTRNG